jgi:XTP/dITP diphosphohydrolase
MVQAMRLQEKASQVGFDWENSDQVWEKVKEELGEVEEVQGMRHEAGGTREEKLEEELGDLMFSVVNFARFNKIDADNALTLANKKFIYRFKGMEQIVTASGKNLTDLNLQEMDAIWKRVKMEANLE